MSAHLNPSEAFGHPHPYTHLEASAGVTRPRTSCLICRTTYDGVAWVEGGAVRKVKVLGGDENEGVDSLAVALESPK